MCTFLCVFVHVCLCAHACMCFCGWRSCPCAEAPPPPLQAQGSPAVSLLSGIGSLINFISVRGGEQLLPVCAGEDVENVLVSLSLLQCKWNKNESNHSQMCPKVFNNHQQPLLEQVWAPTHTCCFCKVTYVKETKLQRCSLCLLKKMRGGGESVQRHSVQRQTLVSAHRGGGGAGGVISASGREQCRTKNRSN